MELDGVDLSEVLAFQDEEDADESDKREEDLDKKDDELLDDEIEDLPKGREIGKNSFQTPPIGSNNRPHKNAADLILVSANVIDSDGEEVSHSTRLK